MTEETPQLEQWMQAAQGGDSAAYAKVLAAIAAKVRPFLKSRMSASEVEDVLQEILISVHKARHTWDASRPLMPWVMAIARYRLTDFFRAHYRRDKEMLDDGSWLENMSGDENVTDMLAWRESLKKTLGQLPPRQQEIIRLMYFEDLSVKEVAEKLQMGESAVKVNAHRGYKKLRELLEAA